MKTRLFSRTLASALLLIVMLGFAYAAFTYLSYYASRSAQILEHRHALGRLLAFVEQSAEIDRLAAIHRPDEVSNLVFEASTTPLLIAQLQKQLQAIAMTNQAQFIRASELPARQHQGFTLAGLKLEVTGTIESLAKTLQAIESSVPALLIETATIAADPATQSNSNRIPQLAMSLQIFAVGQIDRGAIAAEAK